MKMLQALASAFNGMVKSIAWLIVAGVILLLVAGNATIRCSAPSWFNNNYSCQASVIIPNR